MNKTSIKELKSFLIRRLIIVTVIVAAAEAVIMLPVRGVLLPIAARLSQIEALNANASASFDLQDLSSLTLIILQNIFKTVAGEGLSGAAQTGWLILGRSGAFLLLLICIAAFLLPIILGILFYANTVSTRMAALQKQREDEYRTNEERRNLLLSDLAHDLRTPIMTISGYSRAINDGMVKDAAQQHEYLDAIERKSSRMAELIDILFEFTKLGSQGFKLDLADCDINALLAESAATLYSDIEEAGMELDVDIPDEPFTASADRIHTTRLFSNLIINAVRHNPAGTRILIKANRLAGAEYITFADSGVLIEKDIETLFVPFAKGDSSRAGGGSGLGLSIVKKITELQGWELKLAQPCGAAPEAGGCEGYTKAFVIKIPEK